MAVKRKMPSSQGKYVLKRQKLTHSLGKKQVQEVKRLMRREMKKQDELKYFKYEASLEAGPNGTTGTYAYWRSYNIFYHNNAGTATITRGTGDNQFLGDKLRWKGIAVKYRILNGWFNSGWTYSNQPIVIDVMLIKAPALYTTTSLPITSIFNDTSGDANLAFMQAGYKVLKKKTIKITPAKTGDQLVRTGKLWLRRDQNIEYRDFESGFDLKDSQNYYLYFVNRSQGGTQINIAFSYQNYFIDS